MGIFDGMLKDNETLFKNEIALDFSYQPKIIRHRENEQMEIAYSIRPLFQKRNGRNMLIHGTPGIGKTVAVRHVLREIEEGDLGMTDDDSADIYTLYVNCWQKNTSYKIIVDLCDQIGYKFTQNKKTDELMKKVASIINKKSAVFVFDEVDKLEEYDFLYTLLEQIYRKSIIMITNYKEWILNLDERIKSRLSADILEFSPYDPSETRDILDERKQWAFYPDVWDDDAFDKIVQKTIEKKDIRSGLHLMKEAGLAAEFKASRTITSDHVRISLEKIDQILIKKTDDLKPDERFILNIVKNNSGEKIGSLYKIYKDEKGTASYKTFQRKIKKLADNNFVSVKKILGGSEGSTTIVNYLRTKKLTDF